MVNCLLNKIKFEILKPVLLIGFMSLVSNCWGQTNLVGFAFETISTPTIDNVTGTPVFSSNGVLNVGYSTSTPCQGSNMYIGDTWAAGDYFRVSFNGTGFQNFVLSYCDRTSNVGILNFKVRVSVDLSAWTDVIASYVPSTSNTSRTSSAFPVACDNSSTIYVEFYKVNNAGSTGNNYRLDDILITGTSSCTAPTATLGTTSQTLCTGTATSFSVGTDAGAAATYTWQASTSGSAGTWTNVVNGTPTGASYSDNNTATLSYTTGTTGLNYYYQCVVTNTTAACTASSNTNSVTVNSSASITTQPSSVTTTNSGTAGYTVVAGGGAPLSYQWQQSTGGAFSNISNGGTNPTYAGATSSVLTIANPPTSMSNYSYQCVVLNSCGSATATPKTFIVNEGPCVYETFDNMPASASGSATRTWTGDNGFTWTSTNSRTDQSINSRAINIIDSGTLSASGITGGIGSVTIVTDLPFADANGNLTVYINGISVGTIPYNTATSQTTTISNINVLGTFTIEIVNDAGIDRVSIDDVQWTCYASTNTISTPTLSATSFSLTDCAATAADTLTFTSVGTFSTGNVYTAQLSNSSGSFASPVSLGTLSSTLNTGTINITIPALTSSGSGYLIRVVSSSPIITGVSSSTITIALTCTATSACSVNGAMAPAPNNLLGCATGCNLQSIYSAYGTFCNGTAEGTTFSSTAMSNVINLESGCTATISAEYKNRGASCVSSGMDAGSDALFIKQSGGTIVSESSSLDIISASCGAPFSGIGTYTSSVASITLSCQNGAGTVNMVLTGGTFTVGGASNRGDEIITYTVNLSGTCNTSCPTLLPINLVDFYATANEDKNDLIWKVATEDNILGYIVEKSEDGINYREVALQKPLNNTSNLKTYIAIDNYPADEITYYRLSVLEADWTLNYFPIISIDRNKKEWKPIVFQEYNSLIVQFKNNIPPNTSIQLFNLSGSLLVEESVKDTQTKISTDSFAEGIYFVKITNPYKTQYFKIIISK